MGMVKQPKVTYDDADPKARLLGAVGDISEYKPLNNRVLVATYIRADRTKGGLDISAMTKEDEYQSKTGLVLACGPIAFKPDGNWWQGDAPKVGDWVSFKGSNGQIIEINGHQCRIFNDVQIDMIVPSPDSVW